MWPMRPTVSPEIVRVPRAAERSIESLAAYVVARQPDPWLQLKALHDWMATRMTYDVEAGMRLEEGWRVFLPGSAAGRDLSSCYHAWEPGPEGALPILCPTRSDDGTWLLDPHARVAASSVALMPDPEAVFASRAGACSDYAALFMALGRAAGLDVAYVTGSARRISPTIMRGGVVEEATRLHAWNVARVRDLERPIDVTWDSATCSWGSCTKVDTDWLFTPPDVFRFTHAADDPRWRFGEGASFEAQFEGRPLLTPRFFALGLTLVSLTTQPISSEGDVEIRIDTVGGVAVDVQPHDECAVREVGSFRVIHCHFTGDPPSEIVLSAKAPGARYAIVGAVAVSRG
jgi:transglutaminase/protease-like cytokinesis protein 3